MGAREGSELQGKRIAVLMTDGVEQVEYTKPRKFLEEHGARVTLVAPKSKGEQVQGFNHLTPADRFTVELNVKDARPGDFDGLVLPGGVANPDQLRLSHDAISFASTYSRTLPSRSRLPPAVGTTTNRPASGPPLSSMNCSMMFVFAVDPPPTMSSVPRAGPYSGAACCSADAAGAHRNNAATSDIRRSERRVGMVTAES